jgi:cytoskeletal protein CcmA (bactofilin family)
MNKLDEFSIIDKELTVEGILSTKGRLVVKGVVKGTLVGENVVIAEDGAVFADTKVNNLTIGGTFEGEVRVSNELIVLSTGNCSGKIVCKDFIVEAGGILNAQVSCIKPKVSKTKKGLFRSKKI